MRRDKNIEAFFDLLRAGLWEVSNDNLNHNADSFKAVDWQTVFLLAQEQSVQGLVLQGLEWFMEQGIINKAQVPQELLLQWIGEVQMIESRNKAMNEFVAQLIERLRKEQVYVILVKGQGIAQCYEKPLWRAAGDVDLLVSGGEFDKAQEYLLSIGERTEKDKEYKKHSEIQIGTWDVELHGTMRGEVKKSIDHVIDEAQRDVFYNGKVRSWQNGNTTVFLPAPDEDVIIVFTHILQHFFREGVGVRQICDWCRLMWTCRSEIDVILLEKRLRSAKIMTEWRAFAAFAVDWLGMPIEAMPLYDSSRKWRRKAERIMDYVLEVGNFGHNRDLEYKRTSSFIRRLMISFGRRVHDFRRQVMVFPMDSVVAFWGVMKTGFWVVGKMSSKR